MFSTAEVNYAEHGGMDGSRHHTLAAFHAVSGYLTERATAHQIKFIETSRRSRKPTQSHEIEGGMNKRLGSVAILLVVTLCLSLSGCHQGTNQDD